jgi:hypothetical protein
MRPYTDAADLLVIKFITSMEQGISELPQTLKDHAVYAIVLGGGYDDEAFDKLKEATETAGCEPVPWLRPAMTAPSPKEIGADYPKVIGERAKAVLKNLNGPGLFRY